MGYELEQPTRSAQRAETLVIHFDSLQKRWQAANQRLALALGRYRALRGTLAPGDPAWIAAQLQIAEARQRYRELADTIDSGELTA